MDGRNSFREGGLFEDVDFHRLSETKVLRVLCVYCHVTRCSESKRETGVQETESKDIDRYPVTNN